MIMADSVLTEYLRRSPKKPKLDKASGESNSTSTHRVLRKYDPYDDEYIRQYLLYYYQFHKSEGFVIDWDELDYRFETMPVMEAYPLSQYKTNDEVIRDVACRAISLHNANTGTRLVFVDHVSASYRFCGGMLYWITFWARDLASSNPEPKLYQTKILRSGHTFSEIYIFRLKPTDEEIAAVQVDPPPTLYGDDPELPTILFNVTGPGSGYMSIPEVAFTRIPVEAEPVSSPEKPELEKSSGESNSTSTRRELRKYDPYDDECIRQYVLYYYQFHKSEGFVIDWDKLDYRFETRPIVEPYRISSYRTNDEVIRAEARRAIAQHNSDAGTWIEFVDHVSGSCRFVGGILYYITFWARDLAESNPEPKLYQTCVRRCGPTFCEIYIFRLRPSDEEIAAVQVDPPPTLYDDDPELPTILFTVTGPGSGYMSIPEVSFTRIPPEVEPVSSPTKPTMDKSNGESNSTSKRREIRKYDPYDDECMRQYVLYYYQFHKSEGFVIDWDKLDYQFEIRPIKEPYRIAAYSTNDEVIRDVACCAIAQHNADAGTRIEFVDHVSGSYRWCGGILYWITFWARDLAESNPEPKLYQTSVRRSGPTFCEIYIFRLRPTDEEIAAVQVDPPPTLYDDDPELPTILFTVTGPGSGYMSIPEVSFTRIPPEVEPVSSP